MVSRKLSLCLLSLALSLGFVGPNHARAQESLRKADVIISDEMADWNRPNYEDYDSAVVPTQFRQGGGTRGRTAATPASMAGAGQRTPQGFTVRLARTPNMMGDFFALPGQTGIVGELFTGAGTNGLAVHQTIQSGSVFADDNISLITTDPGTMNTVFLGGPGGVTPGTFFLPSIAPNVIQNPQTGLTLDSGDPAISYTAVLNGDVVDVYDDPVGPVTIPNAPVYQIFQVSQINFAGGSPGDLVGRVRIQDNNNTMPRDRVFFDYNYFHNVPFTANGIDVNRFTPGVEKTFLNGMGSVEVRVPMAVTFSSNQPFDGPPQANQSEFGNISLISKFLLTSNEECAVAAGLAVALPTADDYNVYGTNGAQVLGVTNDSVHLVPFLAFLYTPMRSDCFAQVFVTADVDANGNPVYGDMGTGTLEEIGTWNDQTLLSASGAFGKYVYQNFSRNSRVQSVALISEFHYTATANDSDVIASGPYILGNPDEDISLLNGTFGIHTRFRDCSITTGYTVPLTSSDRIFDGEARVFLNRFF